MKRREILKMLGAGALSLAGIERLVKAMAVPSQLSAEEEVCVLSVDGEGVKTVVSCPPGYTCPSYACPGISYECLPPHNTYECLNFWCPINFTCGVTKGDFTCRNNFSGCSGPIRQSFSCSGIDAGAGDHQFNCSASFNGCAGEGRFTCDDFYCKSHYECGKGNACVPPHSPFSCSQPPGNPYSASPRPIGLIAEAMQDV